MKKIITALSLALLLTACGNGEVATTEQLTTEPVEAKAAAIEKPMTSKEAITVEVLDKKLTKPEFQEYMTLNVKFQNESDKELTGVKGALVYFDKFGDEIISLNISDDALNLPVDGWISGDMDWDYNPYINADVKFMETDLEDMTYEFRPHTILFADGSTL